MVDNLHSNCKQKRIGKSTVLLLSVFLFLAAIIGVLFIVLRGESSEPQVAETPNGRKLPVEVALANRTLCATGFPVRFCEHQTASVRGSAPYVVVLADDASKPESIAAVRKCGARVIGPLPPNAFLVETSIFSLGKLSQDSHFVAASEWLPGDKIDQRLKTLLASGEAMLDVTLVALGAADVEGLASHVLEKGGERLPGCLNGKNSLTLKMPRTLVEDLAKRGDVRWMEPFNEKGGQ